MMGEAQELLRDMVRHYVCLRVFVPLPLHMVFTNGL